MHSQQLIAQVKNYLFSEPQKCIKILSNKSFLNNLFQQHLEQLTQILESGLQKMNKQNKNISFASANHQNQGKSQQMNAQLIVCMYSIIIMKSTSKSIISSEQHSIFSSKLAQQTLLKIHRQTKQEDLKKIVTALLLKVPNFSNNHKNIVKDLDPNFISIKTIEKASANFRNQCPNLFEQKLNAYKNTEWSKFLLYKPFKLDNFSETFKKLEAPNLTDANILIEIKEQLKAEFQFLLRRISLIQKQQFFIYEFCEKFSELFKIKLEFPKINATQRFNSEPKNQGKSLKNLPNYNINQLRLKVLLEARNYLLIILNSLISKLSSYWTRKIKWLYEFIIERVEIYGLQEMGLLIVEEPQIYVQKLRQLKLTIKLCHSYYVQFGDGLFPEQKLKAVLFTHEFSFYKMIEAILYNQYQFLWKSQSSRIVNYQKNKKITQQAKNRQNLIKVVNINSKSLNINPHYDLVFQKIIHQITYKQGSAYSHLRQLIAEALKFMNSYYKKSQTYFYGGNLISTIQNCKNSQIVKHKIIQLLKDIKSTLYPNKKMIRQGLQFFCQEVFQSYVSKKRLLQGAQKNCASGLTICRTAFLTIHSNRNIRNQPTDPYYSGLKNQHLSKQQINNGVIRKTKSYDMIIEGWNQETHHPQKNQHANQITTRNQEKKLSQDSQIFYSIKQCNPNDQNQPQNMSLNRKSQLDNANSKVESMKQSQSAVEQDFIITPEF